MGAVRPTPTTSPCSGLAALVIAANSAGSWSWSPRSGNSQFYEYGGLLAAHFHLRTFVALPASVCPHPLRDAKARPRRLAQKLRHPLFANHGFDACAQIADSLT